MQFSIFGVRNCRRFKFVGDREYGDQEADHKTNTGEKLIFLKCAISKYNNHPRKT